MKRSTERILTTHVGSLIRPQPLQDFLRAKQAGRPFDQGTYSKCLSDAVAEVLRRQAQAGVDVISDGEFGKSISWSQYVLERLSGFERRPVKAGGNPFQRGADRERFAEFYAELDAREEIATRTDSVCVGPITYTGQAELQRDIDNFKAALASVASGQRGDSIVRAPDTPPEPGSSARAALKGVKVEEAFLPVAAPASVIPDRKNEYYKSDEDCLVAIGEA